MRSAEYADTSAFVWLVGDEVTRLISIFDWRLRVADFQNETPHVVSYGKMGPSGFREKAAI